MDNKYTIRLKKITHADLGSNRIIEEKQQADMKTSDNFHIFTTLDSWPKSTRTLCHSCKGTIEGIPKTCINKIYPDGDDLIFITEKILTCSWKCSEDYINNKYKRNKSLRNNKIDMLKLFHERLESLIN